MATEAAPSTTDSTEDISGQEQQENQQQAPTDDTSKPDEQQQAPTTVPKDAKLPDDHPVVKQLRADKEKLSKANTELAELRVKSANLTKLEEELAARPTAEALDTLQTRYDRLEAFAQAVGIGRALDSRTFTRDLFETDKPVEDLVKDWNKANPTATATALGSSAAQPADGKIDPNQLLRIAAGK